MYSPYPAISSCAALLCHLGDETCCSAARRSAGAASDWNLEAVARRTRVACRARGIPGKRHPWKVQKSGRHGVEDTVGRTRLPGDSRSPLSSRLALRRPRCAPPACHNAGSSQDEPERRAPEERERHIPHKTVASLFSFSRSFGLISVKVDGAVVSKLDAQTVFRHRNLLCPVPRRIGSMVHDRAEGDFHGLFGFPSGALHFSGGELAAQILGLRARH